MSRKKRKSVLEIGQQLAGALSLPKDALGLLPGITAVGNEELSVSGYGDILEYSDTSLRLLCGQFILNVMGKKLEICFISPQSLKLRGVISEVKYDPIN